MDGNQIFWNYTQVVGYGETADGSTYPIFYREGSADSSVSLPTGAAAAALADGCLVLQSDAKTVKIYNKLSDAWVTLVTFS